MPRWLKRLNLRIRATISGTRDRELQQELDLHLRLLEEEYRSQGMTPAAARLRARRDFGNPTLIRESSHDLFSFRPLEDLVRDLRYAVRELRRSAVFTVIVVASLAIGIGAATSTFAIVDAIFLRALPVHEPHRLVAFSTSPSQQWGIWSYAAFRRWQGSSADVYDVAASSELTLDLAARADERPQQGSVSLVSLEYFRVVGADIALGRSFAESETAIGSDARVAIISDAFWQRWFGGTPLVLTRTIELRGVTYAVIGVTGRGFTGHTLGAPTDIWVPLAQQPSLQAFAGANGLDERAGAETRWLTVIARLKRGVSREEATTVATHVRQTFLFEKAAILGASHREVVRDRRGVLRLLTAAQGNTIIATQFARPLLILAGITALVLLVACTNFTNLMFARSEARRVEFIIRLALGGGRWRLLRQAAAECLGLSAVAGAFGVLFASWATTIALSRVNEVVPIDLTLNLNGRVLGFAVACIAVSTFCGLWPCVKSARSAAVTSTQQIAGVSRNGSASPATGRMILIAQLTMCAVLLIGAGLLLRTVLNLRTQDLGLDRDVLLVRTAAARPGLSPQATKAAVEQTALRLAAVPGVRAVGIVGSELMDPSSYWVDGTQALTTDRGVVLPGRNWTFASVDSGFFEAAGMTLMRGSTFRVLPPDGESNELVLNRSLATFLFGSDDPIGRRIRLSPNGPLQTVTGVVQDARQISARDRGLGVVYQPVRQFDQVMLAVRTVDGPSRTMVRRQIQSLPPALRLGRITTIADELDRSIARERLMSSISLFLAALVVVIGCVGLYALMSYEVARRNRELGIRLALGATGSQVMALVLGDGVRLVIPALAIGLPLGIVASRLVSSQFYDVSAGDPSTLVVVAVLLSVVTLAATFRPARAASRIDPLVLLRSQ